ncbi:MAG: transcription elongation factor GreA [Candidatus Pacebacteria bacterium]|nr:transcription elongation factor GreA [Candidatus Paceibacterota bacterium]MCF7863028.1 transcription elongation factor GreA [Candidatus Paceibacterota bacterium]
MDKTGNYITAEKKEALEIELKDLKGAKRKEILDALEYAKSLGDLSENAEYHQAREDQGKLEAKIAHIESVLQSAIVVSGGGGDIVQIGSKIVVKKTGDKEDKNYMIVGSEEADMSLGKISNQSPLGTAFFGKKKGDTVKVTTPGGEVSYKIVEVA